MKKIALILSMIFFLSNITIPISTVYADEVVNEEVSIDEIDSSEVIDSSEGIDSSITDKVENIDEEELIIDQTENSEELIDDTENLEVDESLNTDINSNEEDVTLDGDVNKGSIYEKVKRPVVARSYMSISEEENRDMEREEYREDYEAALNMDYLVPMTDSEFEVVLAYNNGDYSFIDEAGTLDQAVAKSKAIDENLDDNNIIPCVIDSDGIVVYSTNSMARFIQTANGQVTSGLVYLYPNSNLSGSSTYINHNYVDDAPIIQDNGNTVQVMVNGYKGWVKKNTDSKNYDVVVIPMNQVYNPSYYIVKNGVLNHFISTDITDKNGTKGSTRAVGVAPSYLKEDVKYYSYDANYFYTSLDTLISDLKSNRTSSAVNGSNKFYNYYQYLPFRSKSSYTASQINSFINANTESNSKLRNTGNLLVNAQNKYGVNAAIILGIAINESAWGMSTYALQRNNLFGLEAYDSNPDDAKKFSSVEQCINEFAYYWISKGYSDPQDWRYFGGFLGGKYLGANVKYASDPFWGEKAASYAFAMDKYLSNNDLSILSDYNYNQLGIYSAPTTVKNGRGVDLYTVTQNISSNATFVGVPVVLTSATKYSGSGKSWYEVVPERTSQLLTSGGAEFAGEYDWTYKGYIDTNAITLINTSVDKTPAVTYSSHVQSYGWQEFRTNGQTSGTEGKGKRLEAIKIKLNNYPGASVKYSTHVQSYGWQSWKSNGEIAGTSGEGKRIEAIKIEATGLPDGLEIQYRVHIQGIGWQEWKSSGQIAGTTGQSKRIEAIQIKVDKKLPTIKYKSHVQSYGWQDFVSNGTISGTEGKAKRLEGIVIEADNLPAGTTLRYRTHVQSIGWENSWKTAGQTSGTVGQGKRLEAIQIELSGAPAGYHVEYRTHIQGVGWESTWKRDGQVSGTVGKSKRLEAIQIRIVKD